jgi:hypothetical protein
MAGRNTAAQMLSAGRERVSRPDPEPTASAPEQHPIPAVTEVTRRPVAQYEKISSFITPEQRQWLKDVVREAGIDGLSGSDVVRLALARLQDDAASGELSPTEELIEQAYREAEQFPGRKNRGLPPRRGSAA